MHMGLSEKELQQLKEQLERGAGEFEVKLKATKKDPEFGDDVDGFEEKEDEVEEYSNQLGIQQNIKNELEEIENALAKMDAGIYGVCENCKKEIGFDLLNIDPESRLCKDCKKLKNK